jgi:hypothetical protein
LFGQSQQDLILIIDCFRQERHQLGSRAFFAQSESNRRELLDRVQSQLENEEFQTFLGFPPLSALT